MEFYITDMYFMDKMRLVDYWVNEKDAYDYWDAHKEDCIRAVCLKMSPDKDNFQYTEECLGEFDVNGHYCYEMG